MSELKIFWIYVAIFVVFIVGYYIHTSYPKAKPKLEPYVIGCATLSDRVRALKELAEGLEWANEQHDSNEFKKYAEEDRKIPCKLYDGTITTLEKLER